MGVCNMPTPSNLLYALIARGTVVLAEHSVVSGNANLLAMRILEKLPPENMRVSYTQDQHMFHVLVNDGITFLCVSEESFGRRIPFAFLEDLKQRFFSTYAHICNEAVAYEYNADFSPVMADKMAYYSNDPKADAINRVRGEIMEVKNIMIENVEKVLDRGEKLDLLVDKTEYLQGEAFAFRREARRLKQKMWWKNVRMWVVIALIAAFIVYFCVGLACGFTMKRC